MTAFNSTGSDDAAQTEVARNVDRSRYRLLVRQNPDDTFEYVIEWRPANGTWRPEMIGLPVTDHTAARRAGEARWRELVGPLYVEAAPLGPVDAADAGGDAQMSTAYSRRFVRLLTDGIHFGVIQIECYVLNTNPNFDEPSRPVLTEAIEYAVCADPDDPDRTAVQSPYASYRDIAPLPGQEFGDEDAFQLSVLADPAAMDWDGQYVPPSHAPQAPESHHDHVECGTPEEHEQHWFWRPEYRPNPILWCPGAPPEDIN